MNINIYLAAFCYCTIFITYTIDLLCFELQQVCGKELLLPDYQLQYNTYNSGETENTYPYNDYGRISHQFGFSYIHLRYM